jgi:AcrR family transcriptional regulator
MSATRGRPPGRTVQGTERRDQLYAVATRLFVERGYEATTLRAIADAADVSPALLYRYFPSKTAVVMALYDDLSAAFEATGQQMPAGSWVDRFRYALTHSLGVLRPHRDTLAAVLPVLMTDREHGLFSENAAFSRRRVEGQFLQAVAGASDVPSFGAPLGRLLYLAQLGAITWMLLDRSPSLATTDRLVELMVSAARVGKMFLWVPGVGKGLHEVDRLVREGLYGEAEA